MLQKGIDTVIIFVRYEKRKKQKSIRRLWTIKKIKSEEVLHELKKFSPGQHLS